MAIRRDGVVHHQRNALGRRVQGPGHRARGRRQHGGEPVQGDQLVVPRIGIDLGDAGPGEVVVELVHQEPEPRVRQPGARVGQGAQPVGRHRRPFRRVAQLLVAAVPALHRALGRVRPRAVRAEDQFAVVQGQGGDLRVGQVAEHLVRRCGQHLDGAGAGDADLQLLHVRFADRAALIPHAKVAVAEPQAGLCLFPVQRRGPVLRFGPVVDDPADVVPRVQGRRDFRPVGTAPPAHVEGDAVDRTPVQFLGRKSLQAAVRRHGGQRPPEPEAVRQEDVDAGPVELAPEEAVAVQELPRQRLGRHDVHVAALQGATRRGPAPVGHVALQALPQVRVVLAQQMVAMGPLEAVPEAGVPIHQVHRVPERRRDELLDRLHDRPPPLGVQVRNRHHVQAVRGDAGRGLVGPDRGRRQGAGQRDQHRKCTQGNGQPVGLGGSRHGVCLRDAKR